MKLCFNRVRIMKLLSIRSNGFYLAIWYIVITDKAQNYCRIRPCWWFVFLYNPDILDFRAKNCLNPENYCFILVKVKIKQGQIVNFPTPILSWIFVKSMDVNLSRILSRICIEYLLIPTFIPSILINTSIANVLIKLYVIIRLKARSQIV